MTFEDANLEAAVRDYLEGAGQQADFTCRGVVGVTTIVANQRRISSIVGIQNFTSLEHFEVSSNSISDISPLSGLTSLTFLFLGANSITDVSALSGLTNLGRLRLNGNSITDISALSGLIRLGEDPLGGLFLDDNPNLSNIQPLLDNIGLGAGDLVSLGGTSVSCTDVAALEAKGVTVVSDCP